MAYKINGPANFLKKIESQSPGFLLVIRYRFLKLPFGLGQKNDPSHL
jgi:hypothetical protein